MSDVKQYQFIRNYEKDVLCYVFVDKDDVAAELTELAQYVEDKFHLGVLNLKEILEELPHGKNNGQEKVGESS